MKYIEKYVVPNLSCNYISGTETLSANIETSRRNAQEENTEEKDI